MPPPLRIIPLGGLGEVGVNMLCVECGDDIVVIDAGLMFPKADTPGVDLALPDASYLFANADRVRAVLITHGHEDHVGALPYLLPRLPVPVYAPPLARDLIDVKLRRQRVKGCDLREADAGSVVALGGIEAEYFRVCHSIPDACGVALRTPAGLVVHTGDFKIDHTPVDGRLTDLRRLAQLGDEDVLLLLSDSTYAESPGYTPSESVVSAALDQVIGAAEGRVLVATFASLIARVQQTLDAAVKHGRKVAPAGRSMIDNARMAAAKGYLKAPPGALVDLGALSSLPSNEQVIVLTGAQGEPLSALARAASGGRPDIAVRENDTVVLSATAIPGNETTIASVMDNLARHGAKVLTRASSPGVHVPGHASQEELKLMLRLMKPRYFVPIHGEYRMLAAHASLARNAGVAPENVFVMEDGDVLEIDDDGARPAGRVPAGRVYVDGLHMRAENDAALRDRRRLARDGFVVVVVPINRAGGKVRGEPEVVSGGFASPDEDDSLTERVAAVAADALRAPGLDLGDGDSAEKRVRDAVGRFLYKETRRRPMIIAVPMDA